MAHFICTLLNTTYILVYIGHDILLVCLLQIKSNHFFKVHLN